MPFGDVLAGVVGVHAAGRKLKEKAPLTETLEQAELTARALQGNVAQRDAHGR